MNIINKTLGELTIDNKGTYGISATAVNYSDNLYTYLRITDINDDGTLNYNNLKSISNPNACKYLLKPNDLVIARTGASVGRNYFYEGFERPLVYAGFLIKFSLDPNKVHPKYLKYYCQSEFYKKWIYSYNSGSTRGNINAKTLCSMPVLLPKRNVQNAIVHVMENIDKKIEINNKINDNLELEVNVLYQNLIHNCKIGNISFEEKSLSDICSIKNGKRPFIKKDNFDKKNKYPLIGATSVMGYTEVYNTSDKILVTGRVGTHGIIQRINYKCWISDNAFLIKSNYYEFSYQILKNIDFSSINRGSTQPLITLTDLKKIKIICPNKLDLDLFELKSRILMGKYDFNKAINIKLIKLRDTLLPKLMSGEIDVSNIDI